MDERHEESDVNATANILDPRIAAAADAALAKRLVGEDPNNDCSPRHKTLAKALDCFRGDVRFVVEGHSPDGSLQRRRDTLDNR